MSTFLFDNIIFGPVSSRRFGASLGINLLPTDTKVCNFNCVYCECGLTRKSSSPTKFVLKNEVMEMLEKRLSHFARKSQKIDHITFAGNGEPTLHPRFEQIVDDVVLLRNMLMPTAKIAVLSNATTLNRPSVLRALQKVDKRVLKLDAGNEDTFQLIDRPLGNITLSKICNDLKNAFDGDLTIQSLFLRGEVNGCDIDNTRDDEIKAWIEKLAEIKPKEVMLYSIDRSTPESSLEKVSEADLASIARKLSTIGLPSIISV